MLEDLLKTQINIGLIQRFSESQENLEEQNHARLSKNSFEAVEELRK